MIISKKQIYTAILKTKYLVYALAYLAFYNKWIKKNIILDPRFFNFDSERQGGGGGEFIKKYIINSINIDKKSPTAAKKYLMYYETNAEYGINHCQSNLRTQIYDAKKLKRICIINPPKLSPNHNNGIALNTGWNKYLDLKKILKQAKVNYILHQNLSTISFANDDILIVEGEREISIEENKRYKLIVKKMYKSPLHRKIIGFSGADFACDLLPSTRILTEAKYCIDKINSKFFALHIRRSDKLNAQNIAATSPPEIMNFLMKFNPTKLPIYLMTDEKERGFYDNLKPEFVIYRSDDFANLKKIALQNDNYFLFSIEKIIFDNAYQKHRFN